MRMNYHTAVETQSLTGQLINSELAGWDSQEIPPGS